MSEKLRYPAHVYWSDDDDGFIVIAPDLPGCSAFGKTQEEALGELQDAIAAWINAAKEIGNPVPQPSQPPAESAHSGKVLLRTTRELHAMLARAAKDEGVSLNHYINQVLSIAIGQRTAEQLVTYREPSRSFGVWHMSAVETLEFANLRPFEGRSFALTPRNWFGLGSTARGSTRRIKA
jgi:predicted RNase H-like HicB family nuclease